ncbi:MAG: glycosyltransferase family 9 protein [Marinifilaceae bacterium]
MKRIIIHTPNFLGDTINCTPAIELIKQEYPDAKLTIVGPDFVRELFAQDKQVEHFITFPLSRRKAWIVRAGIVRSIRKHGNYDLGFLFANSFNAALLFKLGGVKHIIGYKNDGRNCLLNWSIKLNRNMHYINIYARLVNEFLAKKYIYLPPLTCSYTACVPYIFNNNNKVIALYLGGENKQFRRYPDHMAMQLCQDLYAKGYNLVFVGDAIDNIKHEAYANKLNDCSRVVNLTNKTNISEYISAIGLADLLITIDSSALHIGALTKRPTIAMMGLSTSPTSAITPKGELCTVLKVENNMIQEENYINNITPNMIIEQVEMIINKKQE